MAVQRRRPGVPRRSFGISLTPPLIISLFLPASFVAESGNAPYKPGSVRPPLAPLPVAASRAAGRPRYARTSRRAYANIRERVYARTHTRARAPRKCVGGSLAAGKKGRGRGGGREGRRTGEVACKFASGITPAEMQKSPRGVRPGRILHLSTRDRRTGDNDQRNSNARTAKVRRLKSTVAVDLPGESVEKPTRRTKSTNEVYEFEKSVRRARDIVHEEDIVVSGGTPESLE